MPPAAVTITLPMSVTVAVAVPTRTLSAFPTVSPVPSIEVRVRAHPNIFLCIARPQHSQRLYDLWLHRLSKFFFVARWRFTAPAKFARLPPLVYPCPFVGLRNKLLAGMFALPDHPLHRHQGISASKTVQTLLLRFAC